MATLHMDSHKLKLLRHYCASRQEPACTVGLTCLIISQAQLGKRRPLCTRYTVLSVPAAPPPVFSQELMPRPPRIRCCQLSSVFFGSWRKNRPLEIGLERCTIYKYLVLKCGPVWGFAAEIRPEACSVGQISIATFDFCGRTFGIEPNWRSITSKEVITSLDS